MLKGSFVWLGHRNLAPHLSQGWGVAGARMNATRCNMHVSSVVVVVVVDVVVVVVESLHAVANAVAYCFAIAIACSANLNIMIFVTATACYATLNIMTCNRDFRYIALAYDLVLTSL